MKRRSLRPGRKGTAFTLVEILVALAIVAVLAALALPQLRKARDRALVSACTARLGQLGVLMNTYATDHDNNFPGNADSHGWNWRAMLMKEGYVPWTNDRLFFCPGDTISHVAPSTNSNAAGAPGTYVICTPVMLGPTGNYNGGTLNRASIVHPSKQYMLTEAHAPNQTYVYSTSAGFTATADTPQARWISPSHGGGHGDRNMLFVDGHVAWVTRAQLTDTKSGWEANNIDPKY